MRKKLSVIIIAALLSGCNMPQEEGVSQPLFAETNSSDISNHDILVETDTFSNECFIELGDNITINGQGAWLDGNCIKISDGGVYTITGAMSDGMIYVDGDDTVKLVLENASITNKSGAAIYSSAKKLIIESAEGTENLLSDGESYSSAALFQDEEPNAAVFAKNDLYFSGKGSLTVKGNYKNGIVSSDELYIDSSVLNVTAENNGINGKDSITVESAAVSVTSGGDSIKTDNAEAGAITLSGCTLTINTEEDGIQADSLLTVTGGSIEVTAVGDILADEALSSKGLKGSEIVLSDCSVTIDSNDHAIKSSGAATITGGTYKIVSHSGKGISAEGVLTVNGGDIIISESEEGIESKTSLNINGGNISIIASDDGINTGGDDYTVDHTMSINGGTVIINAGGDGLDSNGDINVTGGTIVVFGPENSGNAPLDSGDRGGKITVSGGKLIAMGTADMMCFPEGGYVFSRSLNASAGSRVTVADGENNVLISVVTPKSARSVIFCDGTAAEGYKLYSGGTADGEEDENGFIFGGSLSGGTALSLDAGTNDGFGGGRGGFDKGKRQEKTVVTAVTEASESNPAAAAEASDNGETAAEPPEMPEGATPPSGEMPEMPEGATPPSGEIPEMPEGGTPPSGEIPEMPEGATPPSGEIPEMPQSQGNPWQIPDNAGQII